MKFNFGLTKRGKRADLSFPLKPHQRAYLHATGLSGWASPPSDDDRTDAMFAVIGPRFGSTQPRHAAAIELTACPLAELVSCDLPLDNDQRSETPTETASGRPATQLLIDSLRRAGAPPATHAITAVRPGKTDSCVSAST